MIDQKVIGVGLVGFGYWGPNLARCFSQTRGSRLLAICDLDESRREAASIAYQETQVTDDYQKLLDNDDIQLILVATPVSSHYDLAHKAITAGKDVLVEKPFTQFAEQAKELVDLAEKNNRIIAVDHTFLFTGAVRKIKSLLNEGELGKLLYFDSVRINLGLFQHDVNVIYDLAPHDLSILSYLVEEPPQFIQTNAAASAIDGLENIAYLHFGYENGMSAHCHLNWLSPVKIRKILIAGDKKMIVFDDNENDEKVKIYNKGIDLNSISNDDKYKLVVAYRVGEMCAPMISRTEALKLEAEHIIECVTNRTTPLSDGRFGLLVVSMLEAAQLSLKENGRRVMLEEIL